MAKTVIFWILCGGLAFALVLAVQMRVMIALVLRRALKAWRGEFEDREKANRAVVLAAGPGSLNNEQGADLTEAAVHLRATYPKPLAHLRTARRCSLVAPVLLLALVALGRAVLGVI